MFLFASLSICLDKIFVPYGWIVISLITRPIWLCVCNGASKAKKSLWATHDMSLNKKGRKIGRRLSCNKMFVDWVRLVRTGKCLVFGHGAQTPLPLVCTLWVKAKYFLFDPPMLSISMSDYTTFLEEWKFTEMQCENVHVVFFSDCLYQVRMDPFQLLLVKQSLQPGSK